MKRSFALVLLAAALAGCANVSAATPLRVTDHQVRPVAGGIEVSLRLTGQGEYLLGRANRQNCATAPHVRVLEVGTRRVVYPAETPGVVCTQDVVSVGEGDVTRRIELPSGHYVVEAWVPASGEMPKLRAPYAVVRVP